MNNSMQFMARREDWAGGISLHLRVNDEKPSLAQPIVFKQYDKNTMHLEPMVRISIDEAQNLMDELWQCGLRPTEGTGSAGAMAAIQHHLGDMRKLVFEVKS